MPHVALRVLLIALVAGMTTSWAGEKSCDCYVADFDEAWRYTDAIFAGLVVSAALPVRWGPHDLKDRCHGVYVEFEGEEIGRCEAAEIEVVVEVERAWKGVRRPRVILWSDHSSTHAFHFEVGRRYLIYARKEDGRLLVDRCSRTAPVEDTSDFQRLGRGRNMIRKRAKESAGAN